MKKLLSLLCLLTCLVTTCWAVENTVTFDYSTGGVLSSVDLRSDGKTGSVNSVTSGDIDPAIALDGQKPYLLYDRANLHTVRKNYQRDLDDYSEAIRLNPSIPEVWYNRGLARIHAGNTLECIQDLSHAGKLVIYGAYSVIKKYTAK